MAKNILYIIGAGGSSEFLQDEGGNSLTTESLTSALTDNDNWNKTLTLIKRACGSEFKDIDLTVDDFWPILKNFNDNFDTVYANNRRSLNKITNNFEAQIAYLDFIVEYCKNVKSPNIAKFNPVNHCKFQSDDILKKICENAATRMIPIWAREVIHKRINDFAVKDGSRNILSAYFKKNVRENASVNIYSLNYDSLLVSAVDNTDFITGFNENGEFDKEKYLNANNTIAFLHGHQNFYTSANTIQMESDFKKAFEFRARGVWTNDYQTINQKIKSASLITGIDKEKELQVNVYRHYYHKLVKDALEADELFCIGYGCQDDHVNSIIRLFFDFERPITFVGKSDNCNLDECLSQQTNGFLNKGHLNIDLSKVRFLNNGAKSFLENN